MTEERLYLIGGLLPLCIALLPLLPRAHHAPHPVGVTTPLRAPAPGTHLPCADRPAGWFLRDGIRVERCRKGHEFVTFEGQLVPAY